MKMNYLQRNSNKRFSTKNIKKVVIFTIVLIVANYFLGTYIKMLLYTIKKPQTSVYQSINASYLNISNIFTNKNTLISENKDLKMQVETLKDSIKSLKETESRYMDIMEISSTSPSYLYKEIVNKPPFSPFDILTIKSNEQLPLKSLVFHKDILIGQISKIEKNIFEVSMFSSPKLENSFYIERTSNPISVFGKGSGNFYAKVPKDFDIEIGDILVDNLSSRHKMAKVLSIDIDPNISFKDVYLKIPISLYEMSFVNILK